MKAFARSSALLAGLLIVLAAGPARAQQPAKRYDLLIKNGHVIDPKNSINEPRDVAIAAGRIAAVEKNIDPATATKVVDASGLYVTPGLVDMHVHVYAGTGMKALTGDQSVYPDGFSFRACTTTMADAGTSGARNFEDFKQRVIDRAKTRVFAFINIVGLGMGGGQVEQNTDDMDAQRAAEMAKKYPETVVGFKTAHYAKPDWTAVDRVLEAGRLASLPVMIDYGQTLPERPIEELYLKKLRPGDIYTHMYRKFDPTLDDHGKVRTYLFEAKKRGIRTFADAADILPPTANLSRYLKLGFDLVTFSGGKGLRAPQSTGLLLGRRELIEAARMNASPNGDTIGRGMKVNKEEMLGMMVAVEVYLKRDADAEWKEWERRAKLLTDSVAKISAIAAEIHVPPIANHCPTIRMTWEKAELKLTADDIRGQLRDGTPSIEIAPNSSPASAEKQQIGFTVWQMQPGEAEIVAKRLREVFNAKV